MLIVFISPEIIPLLEREIARDKQLPAELGYIVYIVAADSHILGFSHLSYQHRCFCIVACDDIAFGECKQYVSITIITIE